MSSANLEIAALFLRMSQIIEIVGGETFRAVAFARASRALEDATVDVAAVDGDIKALTSIDGVGKGMAERIVEYLSTGRIHEYEELMAQIPAGLLELLSLPGMGPKTIALVWKQAGVQCLADLRKCIEGGKLDGIKGLGPKKIDNIRKSIEVVEAAGGRIRVGDALALATWFVRSLRTLPHVEQAAYAGSLRRGKETIGDIDLLVAAEPGHAVAISDAFVKFEPVAEVLAKGPTKTSIRTRDGVQVDLRIVAPQSFGAALLYFTGSKEHNVTLRERALRMGLRLNEYGLLDVEKNEMVAGVSEDEVYRALGVDFIPPELRENRGEIDLAVRHQLPQLIEIADIKAELHSHTTASDGKWSIRELVSAAMERGFHTVAITDHSVSQTIARGLTVQRLEEHIQAVRAVAREMKGRINVLAGSEVDILADGSLDYPNSLLKELDIVVASPHAALSQDANKATTRLLKAIHNPYVTIVGHPTGRLVNRRPGLAPDMAQVIAAAKDRGVALEINANYYRLDLRDTHARMALEAGVKLAINTDAHGPADLDQLRFGILTARRAGATPANVINCMGKDELATWIQSTRP